MFNEIHVINDHPPPSLPEKGKNKRVCRRFSLYDSIPMEIQTILLSHLTKPEDLGSSSLVCKVWNEIIMNNTRFHEFHLKRDEYLSDPIKYLSNQKKLYIDEIAKVQKMIRNSHASALFISKIGFSTPFINDCIFSDNFESLFYRNECRKRDEDFFNDLSEYTIKLHKIESLMSKVMKRHLEESTESDGYESQ